MFFKNYLHDRVSFNCYIIASAGYLKVLFSMPEIFSMKCQLYHDGLISECNKSLYLNLIGTCRNIQSVVCCIQGSDVPT